MLQGCAELADKFDFAVYTHVYEMRGQVLIARELFADHDGSLISYMDNVGSAVKDTRDCGGASLDLRF